MGSILYKNDDIYIFVPEIRRTTILCGSEQQFDDKYFDRSKIRHNNRERKNEYGEQNVIDE